MLFSLQYSNLDTDSKGGAAGPPAARSLYLPTLERPSMQILTS